MKNSLGKILLSLLTLTVIYAEDFIYDFKIDNKTPYMKEGTVLTLELNQTNRDIVLLFNFDIKKSDSYSFKRVDTIESDTHHNARVKYTYILYPLKDGKIDIEFNLLKKVTSDDSITYSFSGDRDNVKGLVTTDTPITLPPLSLNVKSLPTDTLLVGNFRLKYNIKKHKAEAYEPISFQVDIRGVGYPPLLNSILPKDGNFTKFEEKAVLKSKGTTHHVTYPMALSHSKSFNLSPIIIKAFNPKTEKSYELKIPNQRFDIKKVEIKSLIDKSDSPSIKDKKEQDWSWLFTFFSYILIFGAGYLTAFSSKWWRKISPQKDNSIQSKIAKSKDEKELLQILLATDRKYFSRTIELLDGALYRGEKIDFKRVKREIKI
jgi:hypothetical protein